MRKSLLLMLIMLICTILSAKPLRIIYTNDTHAQADSSTLRIGNDSIHSMGYTDLSRTVYCLRHDFPLFDNTLNNLTTPTSLVSPSQTIWLDAGDEQTGSILGAYPYKKAIGGAVVQSFNLMGLDAATFGNHEFDQSYSNTMRLTKLAKYPFLSANLVSKRNHKPITGKPYRIFNKDGLRIAVIGLTLTELPEKVKIENTQSITVLPYLQTVNKYLKEADEKSDLVVLLTHDGFEADSLLATELDNRVDLIVGGHSHYQFEQPRVVNNILIVSTGAYLEAVGSLDVSVYQDRIISWANKLWFTPPCDTTMPQPVTAFVDEMNQQINKEMDKPFAYLPLDWPASKYEPTPTARLQDEMLLREYQDKVHPDIAMINCGGIRKGIDKGPVTMRMLMEMLPFANYTVSFTCTGSELLTYIALNQQTYDQKPHDIMQSTITNELVYHPSQIYHNADFLINDKPLDPQKTYTVVTFDYVTGQYDKYLGFEPHNVQKLGDLYRDVIARQLARMFPIK